MARSVQEVVAEFRADLERLYGSRLVHLILFGSRARGEATAESDIDVLVVLRGPVDPNEEIPRGSPLAAALCLKYDVVISCVYVSEEDFRGEQSPLMLNVRREGVPL